MEASGLEVGKHPKGHLGSSDLQRLPSSCEREEGSDVVAHRRSSCGPFSSAAPSASPVSASSLSSVCSSSPPSSSRDVSPQPSSLAPLHVVLPKTQNEDERAALCPPGEATEHLSSPSSSSSPSLSSSSLSSTSFSSSSLVSASPSSSPPSGTAAQQACLVGPDVGSSTGGLPSGGAQVLCSPSFSSDASPVSSSSSCFTLSPVGGLAAAPSSAGLQQHQNEGAAVRYRLLQLIEEFYAFQQTLEALKQYYLIRVKALEERLAVETEARQTAELRVVFASDRTAFLEEQLQKVVAKLKGDVERRDELVQVLELNLQHLQEQLSLRERQIEMMEKASQHSSSRMRSPSRVLVSDNGRGEDRRSPPPEEYVVKKEREEGGEEKEEACLGSSNSLMATSSPQKSHADNTMTEPIPMKDQAAAVHGAGDGVVTGDAANVLGGVGEDGEGENKSGGAGKGVFQGTSAEVEGEEGKRGQREVKKERVLDEGKNGKGAPTTAETEENGLEGVEAGAFPSAQKDSASQDKEDADEEEVETPIHQREAGELKKAFPLSGDERDNREDLGTQIPSTTGKGGEESVEEKGIVSEARTTVTSDASQNGLASSSTSSAWASATTSFTSVVYSSLSLLPGSFSSSAADSGSSSSGSRAHLLREAPSYSKYQSLPLGSALASLAGSSVAPSAESPSSPHPPTTCSPATLKDERSAGKTEGSPDSVRRQKMTDGASVMATSSSRLSKNKREEETRSGSESALMASTGTSSSSVSGSGSSATRGEEESLQVASASSSSSPSSAATVLALRERQLERIAAQLDSLNLLCMQQGEQLQRALTELERERRKRDAAQREANRERRKKEEAQAQIRQGEKATQYRATLSSSSVPVLIPLLPSASSSSSSSSSTSASVPSSSFSPPTLATHFRLPPQEYLADLKAEVEELLHLTRMQYQQQQEEEEDRKNTAYVASSRSTHSSGRRDDCELMSSYLSSRISSDARKRNLSTVDSLQKPGRSVSRQPPQETAALSAAEKESAVSSSDVHAEKPEENQRQGWTGKRSERPIVDEAVVDASSRGGLETPQAEMMERMALEDASRRSTHSDGGHPERRPSAHDGESFLSPPGGGKESREKCQSGEGGEQEEDELSPLSSESAPQQSSSSGQGPNVNTSQPRASTPPAAGRRGNTTALSLAQHARDSVLKAFFPFQAKTLEQEDLSPRRRVDAGDDPPGAGDWQGHHQEGEAGDGKVFSNEVYGGLLPAYEAGPLQDGRHMLRVRNDPPVPFVTVSCSWPRHFSCSSLILCSGPPLSRSTSAESDGSHAVMLAAWTVGHLRLTQEESRKRRGMSREDEAAPQVDSRVSGGGSVPTTSAPGEGLVRTSCVTNRVAGEHPRRGSSSEWCLVRSGGRGSSGRESDLFSRVTREAKVVPRNCRSRSSFSCGSPTKCVLSTSARGPALACQVPPSPSRSPSSSFLCFPVTREDSLSSFRLPLSLVSSSHAPTQCPGASCSRSLVPRKVSPPAMRVPGPVSCSPNIFPPMLYFWPGLFSRSFSSRSDFLGEFGRSDAGGDEAEADLPPVIFSRRRRRDVLREQPIVVRKPAFQRSGGRLGFAVQNPCFVCPGSALGVGEGAEAPGVSPLWVWEAPFFGAIGESHLRSSGWVRDEFVGSEGACSDVENDGVFGNRWWTWVEEGEEEQRES